jgi:hypothetical protein
MTGKYELYWTAADGAGAPELLYSPADGAAVAPCGFTRDGRQLLFTLTRPQGVTGGGGGTEIWIIAIGDPNSARPIVQTSRNAWSASVSPDGKYVAFACDESGRDEVYIQLIPPPPVPGAGPVPQAGRRQITVDGAGPTGSAGGGTAPMWLPGAAGELAYRAGDQIIAVRVATEPAFMVGRPRPISQGDAHPGTGALLPANLLTRNYDSMPDGQRLVLVRAEEDRSRVTNLSVTLNWFDELRRRVPVPLMTQVAPMRSSLSHAPYSASAAGHPQPPAPPPATPMNPSFTEAATIIRPPTNERRP